MINPDLAKDAAHKAWLDIWNRDRKRFLTKEIDAVSEATRNLPGIKQTLDQYDRYQNWKRKIETKRRADYEEKGGFHAFLNRVEDGTNLAHQALGMPIEAVSRVTNIDPRAIGAAATIASVGKAKIIPKGSKFYKTIQSLKTKKPSLRKKQPGSIDVEAFDPSTRIVDRTSASVLKKDSMFRKGSKSEVLAKEQSQINRALSGDPTANVFLSTQPYTLTTKRDYIAESGMDVEAALNWLRVEQPAHLKNLLTTGAGKKKVLNTIDQLEKQYAANKSVALKSKIDWYKSMVATGPAMSPSDTLLYGPNTKDFTGNTKALTAHLKGFVDNWESQRHQSTHGHHYHMKALQYSIYKRLFELKEPGIVTEGDILNTHAMLWPSGMTSGSRRSSIMSVDAVPHISTHKLELQTEGQFDTGPIEPTSTPFAAGPLIKYENGKRVKSSRPKDSSGKYIVDKDEWKLIQESGIEVNRFDVEYIKNWAGKNNNIEFGIQKLKKLKSNKKLYARIGPDSKSEIDRIREEIANANSATEIQAIQQSLAENITGPMTESMQRSQDYAEHIGGGELMKYTKDLPGFHKEAAKWNEEQLLFQERLKEKRMMNMWEQSWGLVKKPWLTA